MRCSMVSRMAAFIDSRIPQPLRFCCDYLEVLPDVLVRPVEVKL